MSKLSARAEQNTSQKKSDKTSWPVEAKDIVPAHRQARSAKPEVVYFLDNQDSPKSDSEILKLLINLEQKDQSLPTNRLPRVIRVRQQ